jgi:hypothetical protein
MVLFVPFVFFVDNICPVFHVRPPGAVLYRRTSLARDIVKQLLAKLPTIVSQTADNC